MDTRCDIFAFGAVLYEMITGRRAFPGDSMVSILSAVLRDDPKPVHEIVQGLPPELDRIIARCLRKDPNRRYQHAGDLKFDLEQAGESLAANQLADPGRRRIWRGWWLAAGALSLAAAFVTGLRFHRSQAIEPQRRMTRLTNDAGYSHSPTLSPDGKLLAYSSDRAGDGHFDLYVKQLAGGEPVRLTTDGAGNTAPDFSPDGSKIVYVSNRNGGGGYEIAALGGQSRLIARGGQNPRYSADGSRVAYWIGDPGLDRAVPGSGAIWVAPVVGGSPQKLGSQLTAARYPVWSPDSKHLLVTGYASAKAYQATAIDWWILDISGGEAVRTGFYEAILRVLPDAAEASRTDIPDPGCWSSDGRVVFSDRRSAGVQSLWDVGISSQAGKVRGIPRRLTNNVGDYVEPSCAGTGIIAFTSRERRTDGWLLPFDLNAGVSKGAMEKVTPGPSDRYYVSLSADNRFLAFASNQSGQFNIWVRELASGKELSVASSPYTQRFPVANRSGARIAFSQYDDLLRTQLAADNLSFAPGTASSYIVRFTNGMTAFLSGDTGLTSDMSTIVRGYYSANFAVFNMGDIFTTGPEEAAFAIDRLIRPNSVIPSHVNEQTTMNGTVIPGTKTARFMDLVKSADVFLPLSGTVMEFNGRGRCVTGCAGGHRNRGQ